MTPKLRLPSPLASIEPLRPSPKKESFDGDPLPAAAEGGWVSDRCAACFSVLRPLFRKDEGPRLACNCNPPNNFRGLRGSYLSDTIPEPPHTMEACVPSRENRPTLHLYGSVR